jgi:FdhD protein
VRPTASRSILRWTGATRERTDDALAVERPLEIRLGGRPRALGFLAGEGLISRRGDVAAVREIPADCSDQPDVMDLTLAAGVAVDWTRLERHFAATSACGLCGRAHLQALRTGLTPMPVDAPLDPHRLAALPARLRESQAAFAETGGLHAAAWCDATFEPQVIREDIGRHNAVDKVAGWLLETGRYPAGGGVLWVSGRAGAELVLKAARARIPVLAAIGAPSSLAVDLAESSRMTLVGFLRRDRFNVYTAPERIA